jgi:hypothetical protein
MVWRELPNWDCAVEAHSNAAIFAALAWRRRCLVAQASQPAKALSAPAEVIAINGPEAPVTVAPQA